MSASKPPKIRHIVAIGTAISDEPAAALDHTPERDLVPA